MHSALTVSETDLRMQTSPLELSSVANVQRSTITYIIWVRVTSSRCSTRQMLGTTFRLNASRLVVTRSSTNLCSSMRRNALASTSSMQVIQPLGTERRSALKLRIYHLTIECQPKHTLSRWIGQLMTQQAGCVTLTRSIRSQTRLRGLDRTLQMVRRVLGKASATGVEWERAITSNSSNEIKKIPKVFSIPRLSRSYYHEN